MESITFTVAGDTLSHASNHELPTEPVELHNGSYQNESDFTRRAASKVPTTIIVVASVLDSIGLFGNILLLATTVFTRRMKMDQHAFIVSLSVADTIFLVIPMPFIVKTIRDGTWTLGWQACQFEGYMMAIACHASMYSIAAIAINRYICIAHFPSYRDVFTNRNVGLILGAVWLVAISLPLPSQLNWGRLKFHSTVDSCLYDWIYSRSYTTFTIVIGFIIPLITILVCHVGIWMAYSQSQRRVAARSRDAEVQVSAPQIKPGDIRLVAQLIVIFVAFLTCWAPYLILAVLVDPMGNLHRAVYDVTGNLIVLNAVVNPAFYFFFNATLRRHTKEMLSKCCWRSLDLKFHTSRNRTPTE